MRFSPAGPAVLGIKDLNICRGQFVSIIGTSGCGKSTLLRLIAGLLIPTEGHIDVNTASTKPGTAGGIGMVFQDANLVPWRTARQNVVLPAELGPNPRRVDATAVARLFQLVGLRADDTSKRSSELSGGMQMRVSLARALVLDPSLLLMDEPFAALDDLLRMQLEEDVRRIHDQQGLTTILVTHNISEAVFMSDRVIVLGGHPSGVCADVNISFTADRSRPLRSEATFHELVDVVTAALHATGHSASDVVTS